MNILATSILKQVLSALTSGEFFAHVIGLVKSVADMDISGAEKRAIVLSKLREMGGDLAVVFQGLAGYLVNLAIEAAVAYVAARRV